VLRWQCLPSEVFFNRYSLPVRTGNEEGLYWPRLGCRRLRHALSMRSLGRRPPIAPAVKEGP
jgi:hypothetical protein